MGLSDDATAMRKLQGWEADFGNASPETPVYSCIELHESVLNVVNVPSKAPSPHVHPPRGNPPTPTPRQVMAAHLQEIALWDCLLALVQ